MPAVYIGTLYEGGNIEWRPKFSSGHSDDGPDDRRLILDFRGSLSGIPWINIASYGFAVNIDALADSVPEFFDKKWLRGQGLKKAIISESGDHYIIDIQV